MPGLVLPLRAVAKLLANNVLQSDGLQNVRFQKMQAAEAPAEGTPCNVEIELRRVLTAQATRAVEYNRFRRCLLFAFICTHVCVCCSVESRSCAQPMQCILREIWRLALFTSAQTLNRSKRVSFCRGFEQLLVNGDNRAFAELCGAVAESFRDASAEVNAAEAALR